MYKSYSWSVLLFCAFCVTSVIAENTSILETQWAETEKSLPTPKKKSRIDRLACPTSIISNLNDKDSLSHFLWCINEMDTNPSFLQANPNFVSKLRTMKKDDLFKKYEDNQDVIDMIERISHRVESDPEKEERNKKKEAENSTRKQCLKEIGENADKTNKELMSMINEERGGDLIRLSGIHLLDQEPAEGFGKTSINIEEPLIIVHSEANASKRNLSNLGYMLAAVKELLKKDNKQSIIKHPRFIFEAAQTVEEYWSQERCYKGLDKKSYQNVATLVKGVALLEGAYIYYINRYIENFKEIIDRMTAARSSASRRKK